jgi:hypothetical protein
VYAEWSTTSQPAEQIVTTDGYKPAVLGQHYFISNPAGSGSNVPKFDFTSAFYNGNPNAFAVGSKVGDVVSPDNTKYIDWLMLNVASGKLASQIFRVDTVEGQAASSVRRFCAAVFFGLDLTGLSFSARLGTPLLPSTPPSTVCSSFPAHKSETYYQIPRLLRY